MDRQPKHNLSRRNFLGGTAVAGACLLSAGVLETFGTGFLDLESQEAGAHSLQSNRPHRRSRGSALSVLSREGVKARLGILSDAHLCDYDDTASNKLTRAFDTLAWAAPGIDTFFMLGDVTLNGHADEMDVFASQTAENLLATFSPVPLLHVLMGNHDYWHSSKDEFETFFAAHASASHFVPKQNTVALVEGATIIKLDGPGSYEIDVMDYTNAYDFLAEALEESATNRPDDAILVMSHEPPEYMSMPETYEYGYYGQGTESDMVALMAQYPQVRMFTGHIHNPLDALEAINTDLGFTSVHTSTVGSCLFIRGELVDEDETGSQGLVLDVREDNSLVLHRIDFARQEYIGEPITL